MEKEIKISDEKLQAKLNFTPHKKQQEIINCNSRIRVVCGGKRGGKTLVASYEVVKEALLSDKRIWVVAPTYELTQIIFDQVIIFLDRILSSSDYSIIKKPVPKIQLANGSIIECKSSENSKGMMGRAVDLIVIDEASRVGEDIWKRFLRPNIVDRKGRVIMISTPAGKNWFYEMWINAGKGKFHFTSLDNPIFSKEEWDNIKATTPQRVFEQEYEAKFITDAGEVFRGIEDIVEGEMIQPEPGHSYIMGVDLAKHNDFSVLVVVDRFLRKMVWMDRFNDIDYNLQKKRIVSLAKKYRAKVVIDSSGCLIDNQRIITENGFKALKDIKDGEKVLTGKGNYKSVKNISSVKKKDIEVYKITPSYQTIPTELSFSHQVYTRDGWVEVGELSEGDYLKIPRKLPKGKFDYSCFKNKKLYHQKKDKFRVEDFYKTDLFWRIVGYFIAEGSTRTNRGISGKKYNQISFAFNNKETEYHNDIDKFASLIGRIASKRTREEYGCTELTISCGWLSKWFTIFGKKAHLKKIPADFDFLPDKYKKEIIKGFWRGDGDKMKDKKGFRFHSSSMDLILTMQRWLLYFGIISSLTTSKRKPRDKYVLNIYGQEGIKFAKLIEEECYKIKKINPTVGYIDRNYFYSPIKTIEIDTRNVRLWEFEVEDDNSAFANGLVVHNNGDPIAEDISREIFTEKVSLHSIKTKQQLIEKLSIFIEQKLITIIPDETLIKELQQYSFVISDRGYSKYSAPRGENYHDDCVIALALAVWDLRPTNYEPDTIQQTTKIFNEYL